MLSGSRFSRAALLLQLVRRKFSEQRVLQTASSLTYTTLLSLVPMVTVVLIVMRQFSPFMKLGEGMRGFLLQNLLPEKAGKVVATYALQFSDKASGLTVLGTMMLVITAVMLLSTIDRTISGIWEVTRPRPWYVRIPVYWVALTLGPVIFAASVAAGSQLLEISSGVVESKAWHLVLERLMTGCLLSALFALLFHVIPNRRLTLWHGVVGGLVAGFGVVLVQRLFGFYLARLPSVTLIYGTFSVLPIFLIWVYLSWLAILLGGTLAAVLPEFMARRHLLPATSAGMLLVALRLTQALAFAQRDGRALALHTLAQAARAAPAETERMLEQMREAGWVLRSEEGDWLLCVAAEQLQLGELMARVVVGVCCVENEPGLDAADRELLTRALERVRSGLAQPVAGLVQIG